MSSSYQTLARFDDGHVRSTNGIRQRHRDTICRSRSELKLAFLLKRRDLYAGHDEIDYESDPYESNDHYDEVDYSHSSPSGDLTLWFADSSFSDSPSGAPSPSLSSDSGLSVNSTYDSPSRVKCSTIKSTQRNRSNRTRREILKLRKRVQSDSYDLDAIKREYHELKPYIRDNIGKPDMIAIIVKSRWTTIANALESVDGSLVRDVLDLLTSLVLNQCIRIQDLLFLLQQGLLITIKNSLTRCVHHQVDIINFITIIVQAEPQATPYIIELLSDTGVFEILDDMISMGSTDEALAITKFFMIVFELLCDIQSNLSTFVPLVPDTISRTTTAAKLKELYDPKTSLKLITRFDIMNALINRFFKQIGCIDCDTLRLSMNLEFKFLQFVIFYSDTVKNDKEWLKSFQESFQYCHLDELIERSLKIESIKQYPTFVKFELEQFSLFYRQWLEELKHRSSDYC